MKFKGQGEINICGFVYKKNIADSRGGGGVQAHQNKTVSVPGPTETRFSARRILSIKIFKKKCIGMHRNVFTHASIQPIGACYGRHAVTMYFP